VVSLRVVGTRPAVVLAGLVLAALSIRSVLGYAHHNITWTFLIWEIPDGVLRVFDWVGAILFVPGSIVVLWQVMRGPVVSVGPRCVRDRRIWPAWIPWSAIAGISESTGRLQALSMRLDPAFAASMRLVRLHRGARTRGAGRGRSIRDYSLMGTGLEGGYAALRQAVADGWKRAHSHALQRRDDMMKEDGIRP
jgi:hypothetical protein